MHLVGTKDVFTVYFDANKQSYSVYKSGKLLVDKKYMYSDVKPYLE